MAQVLENLVLIFKVNKFYSYKLITYFQFLLSLFKYQIIIINCFATRKVCTLYKMFCILKILNEVYLKFIKRQNEKVDLHITQSKP